LQVSRNFNIYAIITQRVCVKSKIYLNHRHANKGALDTCSYGVHISNVYAYFSVIIIIIIIIKMFILFFFCISHYFNSEMYGWNTICNAILNYKEIAVMWHDRWLKVFLLILL
jgi:hypothetical protein